MHPIDTGKASSPAFTFGYRNEELKDEKVNFPGPGSYNPPVVINTSPRHPLSKKFESFGSLTERYAKKILLGPGPGSYEIIPKIPLQGYSFGSADKSKAMLLKHILETPPPYSLDRSITTNSPKYSFGHKLTSGNASKKEEVAGSIFYDHQQSFEKAIEKKIAFGFGKADRSPKVKGFQLPGPGTYKGHLFDSIQSPQGNRGAKFTKGPRPKMYIDDHQPGPGAYTPRLIQPDGSNVLFSNAPRVTDHVSEDGPGPKYDVRGIKESKLGTIMPKGERFFEPAVKLPSPDTYSPRMIIRHSPLPSIGKSQRFKPRKDLEFLPGPGQYFADNMFSNLKKG